MHYDNQKIYSYRSLLSINMNLLLHLLHQYDIRLLQTTLDKGDTHCKYIHCSEKPIWIHIKPFHLQKTASKHCSLPKTVWTLMSKLLLCYFSLMCNRYSMILSPTYSSPCVSMCRTKSTIHIALQNERFKSS